MLRRLATSAAAAAGRARLDYRAIAADVDAHSANIARRRSPGDPAAVARLYAAYREQLVRVEDMRAGQNRLARAIGNRALGAAERDALLDEARAAKAAEAAAGAALADIEGELYAAAIELPNLAHAAVPDGGEDDFVVVREHGLDRRREAAAHHIDVALAMGAVELDAAASGSGSRFYYLRKGLALLELGLVQWALSELAMRHGFEPVLTPDVARASVVAACGYRPRGEASQVYSIAPGDKCLIGTSEITLAALHAGRILDGATLPLRMAGVSHCFRAETGSLGAAKRGLYRVHQFTKVEMFAVTAPDAAETELERMVQIQEDLYAQLEIPFRTIHVAAGDLGAAAARKYDIEAWMPGRGRFGEISSTSNCTDYQARRLDMRMRPAGVKKARPQFVHTVNGTGVAVPRILISLLENHQREDAQGGIEVAIPAPLQRFVGGATVLRADGALA